MKRTDICVLILSASLALGTFAGCSKTEEPQASSAESETEASEAETSEITASVETSAPSETSGETDDTEPFADDVDFIVLDAEGQQYANTFISNFAEQYFYDFDKDTADIYRYLDFVHIHLKINAQDCISYEKNGDLTFETFTLDKASSVINKYFPVIFDEEACKALPAPPESYGDQPAGPFYKDGKIWYEAADGEGYDLIAIVDSITGNDDGTITLAFTIYEIDWDTYSQIDSEGLKEYYKLTPDEAASDSTLSAVKTGTAIASIGQSGAYYLYAYTTG